MTDSSYDYDREAIRDSVAGLADVRLAGPYTLKTLSWQDGDFKVEAFHTLDAEHDDERGAPFHRERIVFTTYGPDEGWLRHEVTRNRTGETACRVLHAERIGGYTPNWPAPLEDDDDDDLGPRIPYQGRFA